MILVHLFLDKVVLWSYFSIDRRSRAGKGKESKSLIKGAGRLWTTSPFWFLNEIPLTVSKLPFFSISLAKFKKEYSPSPRQTMSISGMFSRVSWAQRVGWGPPATIRLEGNSFLINLANPKALNLICVPKEIPTISGSAVFKRAMISSLV